MESVPGSIETSFQREHLEDPLVVWIEEGCRISSLHKQHHPGRLLLSVVGRLDDRPPHQGSEDASGRSRGNPQLHGRLDCVVDSIETVRDVHEKVKIHLTAAGMAINTEKSAIQMKDGTSRTEPLQDIPENG